MSNLFKYFAIIESDRASHDVFPQNITTILNTICDLKIPCIIQGDFVRKYFHLMDKDVKELNIYTTDFDYYVLSKKLSHNVDICDLSGNISLAEDNHISKSCPFKVDDIFVNIHICNNIKDIYLHLIHNYLGLDCVVYDYGISTWLEAKCDTGDPHPFGDDMKLSTFGIREKSRSSNSSSYNDNIARNYYYNILIDEINYHPYNNVLNSLSFEYLMDIILERYVSTYERNYYGKSALITTVGEYENSERHYYEHGKAHYNKKMESNKCFLFESSTFEKAYERSIDTTFSKYSYDVAMTILLGGLLKTNTIKIIDEISNTYFDTPYNDKTQMYIPIYGRKCINYLIHKLFPCTIYGEDKTYESNDFIASNAYNQLLDLLNILKFTNRSLNDGILANLSNTNKSAAILVITSILTALSFGLENYANAKIKSSVSNGMDVIKIALVKLESLMPYVDVNICNRALCIIHLLLNCPLTYRDKDSIRRTEELFIVTKPLIVNEASSYNFDNSDIIQLIKLYLLISIQLRNDTPQNSFTYPLLNRTLIKLEHFLENTKQSNDLLAEKFKTLNISIDDITKVVSIDCSYFDLMSYLYLGVMNGFIKNEKNELMNEAIDFLINSKRSHLRWNIK